MPLQTSNRPVAWRLLAIASILLALFAALLMAFESQIKSGLLMALALLYGFTWLEWETKQRTLTRFLVASSIGSLAATGLLFRELEFGYAFLAIAVCCLLPLWRAERTPS